MATEVGKGFVEVVADLDKFGASVTKGISGQQAAFAKSGTDAGKSFSTGVEKEIAGKQSIFSKLGAQQGGVFGAAMSGAIAGGALAGGAAIGAFAINAIGDFSKTALAADKFRDTTGLALDQSSRWIAVADDVGIGAGTIESAFKRMQVSIDKNRSAFGDLIITTASGATDLSATFLNVVSHIQSIDDPIDRANEATKLFGRGFGEISELITTDADKLRESLEGVSEAQIIDEDEVQKARDYQAAMDDLSDAFRDFSIAAGETLIPIATALAKIATEAAKVNDIVGNKGGGLFGQLTGWKIDLQAQGWDGFITRVDDAKTSVDTLMTAADFGGGRFRGLGLSVDASAQAFGNFEQRAAGIGQAMDDYAASTKAAEDASRGLLNAQLALFDSTFAVAESQRAFNDAAIAANTATEDQAVAFEDATQEALKVAAATVQYSEDQAALKGDTLSAKEATQIQIDTLGKLADQIGGPVAETIRGMIGQLQTLDKTNADPDATLNDQASEPVRTLQQRIANLDGTSASIVVRAETANAAAALDGIISRANRINGMRIVAGVGAGLAEGIRNFAGGIALVGEEGPEIVHIPRGSDVYTNAESKALMSSRAAIMAAGGVGPSQGITIINQGTFLGTEEAFGKLADRAIAQARRAGNRAA